MKQGLLFCCWVGREPWPIRAGLRQVRRSAPWIAPHALLRHGRDLTQHDVRSDDAVRPLQATQRCYLLPMAVYMVRRPRAPRFEDSSAETNYESKPAKHAAEASRKYRHGPAFSGWIEFLPMTGAADAGFGGGGDSAGRGTERHAQQNAHQSGHQRILEAVKAGTQLQAIVSLFPCSLGVSVSASAAMRKFRLLKGLGELLDRT